MSSEVKSLIAFKVEQAVASMASPNAVTLVAKGMEIMQQYPILNEAEKKAMLFSVLKTIAAGRDGIVGTDDDVIDAKTLAQLQYMLENNIVQDLVSVFQDVAAGKVNVGKVTKVAGSIFSCLTKPKAA